MRAFKWGTTWPCMSRGCKTAGPQSWARPGIEPGPRRLLHKIAKNVASNPKCQLFFWPQTLTVRSFATLWDTETYNTSFERSDVWLLSGYTFRGVAVLLGLPRSLKVPLLYFIYRRLVHIHCRKLYIPLAYALHPAEVLFLLWPRLWKLVRQSLLQH